MMTAISITKTTFGLLHDRLTRLGFEKRKPDIYSSTILDGVIGWIGLNKAMRGRNDSLDINPVVGVRNQHIERLVAELAGDAFDDLIPPTVAGNVGYLSPAHCYLPFTFSNSGSSEEVADLLCEAVKVHGLPFMTKAADLRCLVDTMQTVRFGMIEQLNYRIPVGLWLLADAVRANAFITAKLSEIGTRGDPAARRYRTFAAKLNERMGR
jgi:hypothetical protein